MRFRFLLALVVVAFAVGSPAAKADDELAALVAQSDEAYNTGRYADAVPIAEHIVALSRERFGEADPRYAAALNALATYLQFTGSLDRAEQLLRQALAIDEKALGPDHPDTVTRESNLALVLLDEDHPVEAAELLHRALASLDRQPAPQGNGPTLSNFAAALERLNRLGEAERLYLAAITDLRQAPEKNGARLAVALGNLGILYKGQHRLADAKPLLEEAVAILEKMSTPTAPHPRLATALNNLGTALEDQGEYAEAEPLYRRALDIDRAMFGPDNPRLATRLSNLANMYTTMGRYDDAMRDLREAMRIDRAAYGKDHPRVAHLLLVGARLLSATKQWEGAYTLIDGATSIMIEADAHRKPGQGHIEAARDIADISVSQIIYTTFLQITGEWPWVDHSQFAKLGGPSFDIAQRLVTPAAAAAIARMAGRYASGNPELADTVRRQQELSDQWNRDEARIIAQLASPADHIDHDAVAADRRQQAETEQALKALDAQIRQGSQNYAAMAGTTVLTIARVQELLAGDEALVYFADDGVHIHAFFLNKEHAAWMPLALTSQTIAEHVEALRCGLDASSWVDERADRCFKLLGLNYSDDDFQRGEALPFDFGRATELYEALFGALSSYVTGKRLIVVPTGALATLPFQVLVTEPPDPALKGDERYRKAAWLARQQPITVLPSVASLEALRSAVPKGRAAKPFLGVGNPLLDGPRGLAPAEQQQVTAVADLARSKETCAPSPATLVAMNAAPLRRGASAGAGSVRDLFALPETADELCAIAAALHGGADDVLLGARATRDTVLDLSRSGALDAFSIIHFATHGLVAGELAGLAEPALALTPTAKTDDNGLLTASDVAGLRLNADWVVLSSCNTAAGSGDNKEAFAGLARAFFLAGTRALMVSHWPVASEAAVALTTGAYKALLAEPAIGRADALRHAMLSLVDQGGAKARPAYWAPFVVVGDGG